MDFKGQLISKANCEGEDSSKKRTNEFVLIVCDVFFRSFFGRILGQKKTFRDYLTFNALSKQEGIDSCWDSDKKFELILLARCLISYVVFRS